MADPTSELVPLERLEALERQFFPLLPDNAPGRDLRAVVLEAITARKAAARDAVLINAVHEWSADRSPDGPGDAELMKAIWTHHGDTTEPCPGCDGECGEPCAPCTVGQAHAMLDAFIADWRKKKGLADA